MANPKIAVYSIPDLKNTTDDALPNYLNSLKFKQSYYLSDVRLALGYSAVLIAGATFAADYKLGWDATKAATLWAVLVYFLLNGALTLWIWGVEKGVVYVGERKGTRISIASSVAKYTPIYNIKVTQSAAGGNEVSASVIETSAPFTRWFDSDGHFVVKPFQQWLASVVPAIAEADPANAGASTGQKAESNGQSTSYDAVTPTPKKKGRPRKD